MRKNNRQNDTEGEHDDTHEQALTGFLRPNIGELRLSDIHRKLPVLLIIFYDLGSQALIADIRMSG